MQIPDAFLANYLPDPSQLWFSIDYDSTNPEVQKISASSGVFCFR